MTENEALLALIGQTYDAALDPTLWIKVLDGSARFVGGPAAALFYKDASSRSGGTAYDVGIEPHYRQTYFEHYIKLDPLTTSQFFAEVDEPVATSDLVPYDEFLESRFYREWAHPQGLVDFATCVLDKSTAGASMFGVFRHERDGVVDEGTRRRMRLLSPHVRRAMMIGRVIDVKERETTAMADALDGLAAAMFLLSANGRIAHANKAGHAMLANTAILGCSRGHLVATDRISNELLQDVIASASKGDKALGTKGVSIALTGGGDMAYVAHALPMTSGGRRRATAGSNRVSRLVRAWCDHEYGLAA